MNDNANPSPAPAPTLSSLEIAAMAILAAPINSALSSIQTTPTTLNVIAQFNAIQAEIIAAAPALEQLGIKDAAAIIQGKLNAYVASLSNQTA